MKTPRPRGRSRGKKPSRTVPPKRDHRTYLTPMERKIDELLARRPGYRPPETSDQDDDSQ